MRSSVLTFCALMAVSAFAERQPYKRYQTIVDRQMFGPPPADFDPSKMPSEVAKAKGAKVDQELSKEQEQVKKAIKFSVLNVTPSGETVVGFSDNGDPKNPLHYYLKVGESQNGWTVKEADKDAATMTIVNKEGIEVTLKLGGDSSANAGAVSRMAGSANGGFGRSGVTAGAPLLSGTRSLRERRRQREEQIRADEAAKHAADTAAREAAEKERAAREEAASQQREAEREEQRKQLQQIQEELRKAREQREAAKEKDSEEENPNSQQES